VSQTVFSQQVAAPPIQVLIIRPDDTHEVREIEQDLKTLQGIVGGYVEDIPTQHCVLWRDEEGMLKDYYDNTLATYLWWNLCPQMEGRAVLQGTVFVTGNADGEDALPVPDDVIEYFERMRAIYEEHKHLDEDE
jgi:hypothetical protein